MLPDVAPEHEEKMFTAKPCEDLQQTFSFEKVLILRSSTFGILAVAAHSGEPQHADILPVAVLIRSDRLGEKA